MSNHLRGSALSGMHDLIHPIVVPVGEHEFEALTGKMSSFSFNMLGADQIARNWKVVD